MCNSTISPHIEEVFNLVTCHVSVSWYVITNCYRSSTSGHVLVPALSLLLETHAYTYMELSHRTFIIQYIHKSEVYKSISGHGNKS